jgi:aldehyde dehydrogenase
MLRNIIPVTLELGGKSPNVFMKSVGDADDAFLIKVEGAAMFCFKSRRICTCPAY